MTKIETEIYKLFQNTESNKDELRKEIFKIYNISEGKQYDHSNSTISEDEDIAKWLNRNEIIFISNTNKTYKKRTIFKNEIDKVQYISQFHCKICELDGLRIFPIRINPLSRQTKTDIKNKFLELIKNSPYGGDNKFKKDDRLCIKIVFVLRDGRDKDLDNMAKITLDGIKELIGVDDKNIDHLNLIKIKTKYIEDHITISICKSTINDDKDILLKGENLGWAGLKKLSI